VRANSNGTLWQKPATILLHGLNVPAQLGPAVQVNAEDLSHDGHKKCVMPTYLPAQKDEIAKGVAADQREWTVERMSRGLGICAGLIPAFKHEWSLQTASFSEEAKSTLAHGEKRFWQRQLEKPTAGTGVNSDSKLPATLAKQLFDRAAASFARPRRRSPFDQARRSEYDPLMRKNPGWRRSATSKCLIRASCDERGLTHASV
jgi:hypothetical protein